MVYTGPDQWRAAAPAGEGAAMSCYCYQTMQAAAQDMAALAESEPQQPISGAPLLRALSDWMGVRALPAPAWQPDPAWLDRPLPVMPLSADAMATISALGQLQAEAQDCLGLDLTDPAQERAFARVVATAQARAQSLVESGLDPGTLSQLAATQYAADQTAAAVEQNVLPVPPDRVQAAAALPMQTWQPWLRTLRTLAPLIAVAHQLGIDLSGDFTAPLSAKLRTLRAIGLPPPPQAAQAATGRATSALAALAQLRDALGVDPLKAGMPMLQSLVAARARSALENLADATGSSPEKLAALVPAQVVARLPALPYCPTSFATPAVVQAAHAINPDALARMTWTIPPASSLAAITAGLPVIAFACRYQAATGQRPARPTPCGGQCDAAGLTKAAAQDDRA